MLVFYPDFDTGFNSEDNEIVLLVDNSESMKGEPASVARRIGHLVLKTLGKNHKVRINIIVFGTGQHLLFLTYQTKLCIKTIFD